MPKCDIRSRGEFQKGKKGRIKISQTNLLAENVTLWERKTISTVYNQHRVKFGGLHGEYKGIGLNLAP